MALENLQIGVKEIAAHRTRSLLTMLGVIFGVAAVIAMSAIGAGAREEALRQIKLLGTNNLRIRKVNLSGQLAIDAETGKPRAGSIEQQTRLAIRNLEAVLVAAGSGLDRVVKTTVYVSDIDLWGRVNAVYSECFGEHRPARAVVPTRDLHFGCLVEIEAVAAVGP